MLQAARRSAFSVVIVSEQKSLGRESFETNFLIKQLAQSGIEIVEYVHGRSLTPRTWIEKATSAILASADEAHREQTRERVHEAHLRLARQGAVVGGKCFGYRNVTISKGSTRMVARCAVTWNGRSTTKKRRSYGGFLTWLRAASPKRPNSSIAGALPVHA